VAKRGGRRATEKEEGCTFFAPIYPSKFYGGDQSRRPDLKGVRTDLLAADPPLLA